MSTRQVERELAAILHRRAEDAMNRTNTQTELLELNADIESRARRDRRRWAGGALAAAAAVVVAGFAVWSGSGDESSPQPASGGEEQVAVETADSFLEALAAGDVDEAESYVASGATPWPGWRNDMQDEGVLSPDYLLQPCETGSTSDAGTRVTCPFDYHLLRSEELGLEPFGNNTFTILVANGKVVSGSVYQDWFNNGQSVLLEKIDAWVRENHPGAWAVMSAPGGPSGDGSNGATRREVRYWNKYTQEYVDAHTP